MRWGALAIQAAAVLVAAFGLLAGLEVGVPAVAVALVILAGLPTTTSSASGVAPCDTILPDADDLGAA